MKPTLPKGTRDFSPLEMSRRNYIFDTIRAVFRTYGYQQIETPAMENLSTLTGKYGDEGDKLIFKILDSGNYLDDVNFDSIKDKIFDYYNINKDNSGQYILPNETVKEFTISLRNYLAHDLLKDELAIRKLSEKALRYDLTVPFARYVVMNRNDITFPFKRYQVQPVWRADRPQKGRYREFYQFDADVVGSPSLVYEAEFFQIFAKVFEILGAKVTIKYNNRKVLNGITEAIGAADKFVEVVTIIDKLDKIGVDKVNEELIALGVTPGGIDKLQVLFTLQGGDKEKLEAIKATVSSSEIGVKGIDELQTIIGYLEAAGFDFSTIEFDPSLARGLSYYTGAIFEVKAHGVQIGSICGGGRYDDLTGLFGLPNVSGVGISFGVDRIYDVLNELNLFPETLADAAKVLVTNFGVEEEKFSFNLVTKLRAAGINADMYPTQAKLGKQFEYADKKKIPFVAVVGADEMANNVVNLKDMVSGVQEKFTVDELIEKLK
jgi:histidyl-tRNA synthetase